MMVQGFAAQVISASIPVLDDLSFDLAKAGYQRLATGLCRHQYPGGPHERIDDVALAERELFQRAV